MYKGIGLCMALILGLTFMGACRPAEEAGPAEFYKGKTIELIVPYAAGAEFDNVARLMAPYIVKHTGAATVVVKNMTGAGGMLAVNYMYQSASRDGLTIATVQGSNTVTNELLEAEGTAYKAREFNWLGRNAAAVRMLMVGAKTPYRIAADLQAAKLVKFAVLGKTGPDAFALTVTAHALGINAKFVAGYAGLTECALSVVQGETEGWAGADTIAVAQAAGGDHVPILAWSKVRSRLFPNVPTIYEAVKLSGENLRLVDQFVTIDGIQRLMVLPPGVPQDRVAFLREAFDKVMRDADYVAESEAKKLYLAYMPGDELSKAINDLLNMPQKDKEQLRYVYQEEFYK